MFFICFLAILLLQVPSFSQSRSAIENDILNTISNNSQDFPQTGSFNQALLLQTGNGNTGSIKQIQTFLYNGNLAAITQNGNLNTAFLYEYGSGLNANVNQQGDNNYLDMSLTGININVDINQNGNDNMINQQISAQDVEYSILQQGSNNEFTQQETNGQALSYSVSQIGNGMKLIIINSSGFLP